MLKQLIVTGGLVALSVLFFKCLLDDYEKENGTTPKSVADISDEQLCVEHLSSGEVKSWFIEKNPDKKYTNIMFYPTNDKIEKFGLNYFVFSDSENYIVQAVFDSNADKVITSRVIVYKELNQMLDELMKKNNGVVILD